MRGKRCLNLSDNGSDRITPAGAGKTTLNYGYLLNYTDHPRRCGENDDIQPEFPNVTGSPPQVRGKPAFYLVDQRVAGITPAGAGKTAYRFE